MLTLELGVRESDALVACDLLWVWLPVADCVRERVTVRLGEPLVDPVALVERVTACEADAVKLGVCVVDLELESVPVRVDDCVGENVTDAEREILRERDCVRVCVCECVKRWLVLCDWLGDPVEDCD